MKTFDSTQTEPREFAALTGSGALVQATPSVESGTEWAERSGRSPYYDAEGVTIYHGDCREIVPSLGRFDLLLTDPPYGVDFKGKGTKHTKPGGGYISGDSEIGPEIVALCMTKSERGIVFPGTRLMREYPQWDDCGGAFCPSGAGMGKWGFACFHPILFYGPRPARSGMWPTGFSSFDNADDCGHPCPKPLRWMLWAIALAGDNVRTILDPFAGSGTTGRAAKDLGKRCVLIEREERYCEIAARRLAQSVLPLMGGGGAERQGELLSTAEKRQNGKLCHSGQLAGAIEPKAKLEEK